MEAAEEEIVCIETNIFGELGFATCFKPPKMPTWIAN